jgi:capsular exopolysaccharide synthesis family protein
VLPLAPPAAVSSGPDVGTLLRALRKRWMLAVSLGIVVAVVAAGVVWCLMADKYTVSAGVFVSQKVGPLTEDKNDGRNEFFTFLKTVAAGIKHREVLLRALAHDEVRSLGLILQHPDPATTLAWLDEELLVEFQEGTEIITVKMLGERPDEQKKIIDAVVKEYLQVYEKAERKQRKQRAEEMEGLFKDSQKKLTDLIEARDKMAKDLQIIDAPQVQMKRENLKIQLAGAQKSLDEEQRELDKVRVELELHKSRHAVREALPLPDWLKSAAGISSSGGKAVWEAPLLPEGALQAALAQDNEAVGHQSELTKANARIKRLKDQHARETEGAMILARKQAKEAQKALDKRKKELREELEKRLQDEAKTQFQIKLKDLETQMASVKEREKKAGERVDSLGRELESLGSNSSKYEIAKAAVEHERDNNGKLSSRLKTLQIEVNAEPRVHLYQEAAWQKKDSKKRIMLVVLAPVVALLGVAFGVAWWEFRARRIQSTDEVVNGLGMRVVGAVPALPRTQRHRFIGGDETEDVHGHNLVESIDAIRTMLLRDASVKATRVVMVTSAVASEGKTTLASNLAVSLARTGRRTLLIDCDLRRPSAHQLFEQTLQPGLSEVLLEEVELPDAVRPTTTDESLFLLPAGQWDREVLAELAKDTLPAVFERLKEEFDFVIVDSHPVLPATDSLLIGQHVDAVIVSLLRDVSQAPRVYAACQKLATLDIRVFGAVVSGMPSDVYDNSYEYSTPS